MPSVSRNQPAVFITAGVASNAVTDPLHGAGAKRAGAAPRRRAPGGSAPLFKGWRVTGIAAGGLDAVHHLDLKAVGLGQAHPPATARLVDRLDPARAFDLGYPFEVRFARRPVGEADEGGLPQLGHMDVVARVRAPACRAHPPVRSARVMPEMGEKFLHSCRGPAPAGAHGRVRQP